MEIYQSQWIPQTNSDVLATQILQILRENAHMSDFFLKNRVEDCVEKYFEFSLTPVLVHDLVQQILQWWQYRRV